MKLFQHLGFFHRHLLIKNVVLACFIGLTMVPVEIFCQERTVVPDTIYGADPLLLNGKIYNFFTPPGTSGNPYLNGADFVDGTLVLRGQVFQNLPLKYDIYNKVVVLGYRNELGAQGQLIVSDAFLDAFTLGDMKFIPFTGVDSVSRYDQIIGDETFGIVYSWYKLIALDTRLGASNHVFYDPKKNAMLIRNQKLYSFKNKRSFLRLFTSEEREKLKTIIKKHKIKLHRATDYQMGLFVSECSKTLAP